MILIKNGLLIDPASERQGEYDVLVDGGRVTLIAERGQIPQSVLAHDATIEIIDAQGQWVLPGLVDLHVHLREPGFEWKETIESGAQAALLGGYTTICCMANTRPVNDHAEVTRFIVEKSEALGRGLGADGGFGAHVLPLGAVTKGLAGKEMAPLSELYHAGCAAFSDDGEPVYNAGLMRRALEWSKMLGVPICCHEEDKTITAGGCMNESHLSARMGLRGMPCVGEEVLIARDIELARDTGGHVHLCHVSTARGVELVRRAKQDGIHVTAEVTPHHLVLTEEDIGDYDTNFKMSPPLRSAGDSTALLAGLRDGVIDVVASDHAPHERDSKQVEFDRAAFGILGLQTSLSVTLELVRKGALTPRRAVEVLSGGARKILANRDLGRIDRGDRADIAIVDPAREWKFSESEVRSLSLNSPFIGKTLTGKATTVLVNGNLVVRGEEVVGKGEMVRRRVA